MLRSISALFVGQLVNIIGKLVLVPLYLSLWSTGVYGEWMALSALVAYFGVTDFGMNAAAGNAMTAAYARGDLREYRCFQSSAMVFYIGIASAASLLFGILVAIFPIPAWIGIRQIPSATAATVVWLLAATLLWQMPAAQLASVYRSTGNLAATEWLGNLQSVSLLGVTLIVLLLHGDTLRLAFWGAVPMIVVTAGIWVNLRGSRPELLPKLSEARVGSIRELCSPSLLFGLIMLSMAVTLQGPVVLVSMALGGAAVALLVTTRTLTNVIRQAIGAFQVALWPELTRLDALGAEGSLRWAHRLSVIGSVALHAAFAGALWFEGASVISAWTVGRLTPDIWLLRLFLLALVLQAPWLASSQFTVANNRHRRLACSYATAAILTLAATALLVRPCGPIAVPLGALFGEGLACYYFVIKDTCRVLKEDHGRFASRMWAAVLMISCSAWSAGYLGHAIAFGPRPLRWMEVGALTTLAAALAAWTVGLSGDDRVRLVRWGQTRWNAEQLTAANLR